MKWIHFLHRDMTVLFEYFAQRAGVDYLAESLHLPGFALRGRKIDHQEIYHDALELEEFRVRVKAGGIDYLEFLAEACEAQCDRLVVTGKESRTLPPTEAFDRYCTEQMRAMAFLPVFPGVIEPIITEKLDAIATKYANDTIPRERLVEILQKPSKPYIITKEEIERYRLGDLIQKNSSLLEAFLTSSETALSALDTYPDIHAALLNHINQFGWIETRHFKGDCWSLEDIILKIKKIVNKDCANQYETAHAGLQQQEQKIVQVYDSLGFSYEDRRWVNVIRDFIYLRTQRKDAMSEATFHMQWAFDDIAKRAGLDAPNLVYLLPQEIKDVIAHPENAPEYHTEIARRKKGYALITYDGETRVYTDEFTHPHKQTGNNDWRVTGTSTFPGEISGFARRIMSKEEITSTLAGEIVVTPTTSPDYIIVIDLMGGIITNEGGVTCHAAQLSREYKIPCIIGTSNATQIFKTGDPLYLNATCGFAEIIKK